MQAVPKQCCLLNSSRDMTPADRNQANANPVIMPINRQCCFNHINALNGIVGIKHLSAYEKLCRYRHNFSEREIRPSVIVRKLSLGSKSVSAAELMSVMISVLLTLKLHGIREYDWLMDYLGACAANGGEAPKDLSAWLPWSMDAQRLERFRNASSARPQAP